jgi:hypothetical protein
MGQFVANAGTIIVPLAAVAAYNMYESSKRRKSGKQHS